MHAKYTEVKVGFVVILASAALLGLLYFATGGEIFGSYQMMHLGIEPGGLAPSEGDPIYMNGIKIGTVQEVTPAVRKTAFSALTERQKLAYRDQSVTTDTPPETTLVPVPYVRVVGKIDQRFAIPRGTEGTIKQSITGTRTLILSAGLLDDALTDTETRNKPIVIRQETGLMDLGEQLSARIDEIADAAVETLGEAKLGMVKAQTALDSANETIIKFREKTIDSGRLDSILRNVDEASASLNVAMKKIEARVESVTVKIESAVDDFAKVAGTGSKIVDAMQVDIQEILDNVKGATAKLDTVVERAGPKIDTLLDDIGKAGKNVVALSEDLKASGPTVRKTMEKVGRDLDLLMESLIETGQNLQDASEDIRAHPWKALNKPEAEEIAYENLRNTMLNYVRAMQRMDRMAGSIRDLLRLSGTDPEARNLLLRSLAQFERSMERYNFFEQRLTEMLRENAGAGR